MEHIQDKLLRLSTNTIGKGEIAATIDFTESLLNGYSIEDPAVTFAMAQVAAVLQMKVIRTFRREAGLPTFHDPFAITRLRSLNIDPETLEVIKK